jgi:hypothetical protein
MRAGRGPAEGEAARRAVLEVDPNHLPTRRKLADLAGAGGAPPA